MLVMFVFEFRSSVDLLRCFMFDVEYTESAEIFGVEHSEEEEEEEEEKKKKKKKKDSNSKKIKAED